MSLPDDLPAGVHAASEAETWALRIERSEVQPFAEIIRAVEEVGLCKSAIPYARWLLGPYLGGAIDAEDAVSAALVKARRSYNPSLGGFKPYFYSAVRSVCADMIKDRRRELRTSAELARQNERLQAEALPDTAVVEDEDMRDRIAAALEVLNLSDTQRYMLGRAIGMLDDAEADQFAHLSGPQKKRAMATARQNKRRGAGHVLDQAGVTAEERVAAKLVRTHPSLAAARAAAPQLDVVGLSKSAERKVLGLFNIDLGDRNDGHA